MRPCKVKSYRFEKSVLTLSPSSNLHVWRLFNFTLSGCATWLINQQVATFSSLASSSEPPQQLIFGFLVSVLDSLPDSHFAWKWQTRCGLPQWRRLRSTLSWENLWMPGSLPTKQHFSCSTESYWFRASEEWCCRAAACVASRSAAHSSLSFWDMWPRAAQPCVLCFLSDCKV